MPIFDDQWFIDLMRRAYETHRHRSDLAHAHGKVELCIKEMQDAVNASKMSSKAISKKLARLKENKL
jgi:hypothetical protein